MLSSKEYATLRSLSVTDAMAKNVQQVLGGEASLEDLQLLDRASFQAAQDRLKQLGISYPTPIPSNFIKPLPGHRPNTAYRCQRSLPGKAVGSKKAFVVLNVLTSCRILTDDRLWFHASVTRSDLKMPTYADICWVKEHFFPGRWAIQFHPTEDQHINDHGTCLHLWGCLEDFPMPDFRFLGSI